MELISRIAEMIASLKLIPLSGIDHLTNWLHRRTIDRQGHSPPIEPGKLRPLGDWPLGYSPGMRHIERTAGFLDGSGLDIITFVIRLLERGEVGRPPPVVVLWGEGGVGKSAIAGGVIERMLQKYTVVGLQITDLRKAADGLCHRLSSILLENGLRLEDESDVTLRFALSGAEFLKRFGHRPLLVIDQLERQLVKSPEMDEVVHFLSRLSIPTLITTRTCPALKGMAYVRLDDAPINLESPENMDAVGFRVRITKMTPKEAEAMFVLRVEDLAEPGKTAVKAAKGDILRLSEGNPAAITWSMKLISQGASVKSLQDQYCRGTGELAERLYDAVLGQLTPDAKQMFVLLSEAQARNADPMQFCKKNGLSEETIASAAEELITKSVGISGRNGEIQLDGATAKMMSLRVQPREQPFPGDASHPNYLDDEILKEQERIAIAAYWPTSLAPNAQEYDVLRMGKERFEALSQRMNATVDYIGELITQTQSQINLGDPPGVQGNARKVELEKNQFRAKDKMSEYREWIGRFSARLGTYRGDAQ